jgi:hypothetical protein
MLSSSPIETGSSPDWHLAGLLTHASSNSRYLPGRFAKTQPLRASTQWCYFSNSPRLQLRGSAGFSPAPRTPDGQIVYPRLGLKSRSRDSWAVALVYSGLHVQGPKSPRELVKPAAIPVTANQKLITDRNRAKWMATLPIFLAVCRINPKREDSD